MLVATAMRMMKDLSGCKPKFVLVVRRKKLNNRITLRRSVLYGSQLDEKVAPHAYDNTFVVKYRKVLSFSQQKCVSD